MILAQFIFSPLPPHACSRPPRAQGSL